MMIALVGLNANAAIYMIGDQPMGGWGFDGSAGVEMTDNGDGTYSYVVTIGTATQPKTVYFAFADGWGTSWNDFNTNHRYGPQNGGQLLTDAWASVGMHGDRSFTFQGTGEEYKVTFDLTNKRAKIEGYVAPIEITTYTVVSGLDGEDWPILEANDMTLANGVYTLTKENVDLTAGTLEYKVVGNHDWGHEWPQGYGNNFTQTIPANGNYDITFTFDPETGESTCTLTLNGEAGEDVYTVTGTPAALFGQEWTPGLDANVMTLDEETGLYTWTKTSFEATDTTVVEFKVVANGNWNTCWPLSDENGDNNWYYAFTSAGTYDIVITFNEETKEITFTATKQGGEEPVEDTYTVAGTQNLFGSDWDPADEANNMVKGEDGIYTWTKTDVEFADVDTIEFKVVKNHSWDVASYPENNWWHRIATAGTYDFVITFNPAAEAGQEITFTATKQGGEEPVEMVYTVVGPQAVFGSDWNETDETNDMVLNEETGLYTWTKEGVELSAGFGFKVVGNHDWSNEWPQGYGNNWNVNIEQAGIYTLVITFNAETSEINCVATKTGDVEPVHYDGDVYILGEVNDNGGWFTNVGVKMTRDAENNVYTATITTAGENIPEGEEVGYSYFSFTKQLADSAADWNAIAPYRFGAVSDGDFWVTDEILGQNIRLTAPGQSFKIPAGNWNLTLSVDNMTLVITKVEAIRGDVNNDKNVTIADVTALIDYLLSGSSEGVNTDAANCNLDEGITIADVTSLIDYLLSGNW